ncbi:MAG: putative 4-hydroxybenzoyl-CoA thioesterase, partial [uncultured Rubrobacteraceae bacterium]
ERIGAEKRGEGGAGGAGPFPAFPDHSDALDGQRRLRARQQRRLLLVLRHGGERVPDPGRRPRYREQPGHRPRRRDPVPLLRARYLSGYRPRGPARRAARAQQRAVRDRALQERLAHRSRPRPLRPRLRRARGPQGDPPPARDAGSAGEDRGRL